MRISDKFLEDMIQEMNAEFDLDFFLAGKGKIFDRKMKENINFDNNKELFNYLCGMRRAFWLIRNEYLPKFAVK
jgi:hypothetical protein